MLDVRNSVSKTKNGIKSYWHRLGPGLVTGASDDDPSGIATYSQTGAQYGFKFIWLSLFTFPLMSILQEMCARIGLVTGQGLAANIRQHYPKKVLYLCTALLLLANIFNIGADLGAMAEAARLLMPSLPFGLMVIFFAVVGLLLQVFVSYSRYAKVLKYLTFALLAYIIAAFYVAIDWSAVFSHLLIPELSFSKDQLFIVCAVIGTTISPYLFFWQTSQEVEEEIKHNHQKDEDHTAEIKDMRTDVWSGMFFSNLVMFFIISTCGAALFSNGIVNINTAADAAEALRPFAGNFSYALFALGILGTGMLAIPVLAGSSAYAVSESVGWKSGLYRKLNEAYAFYGVIVLATLVGIVINFVGIDPIKALIYSAVANGIIAPIMIFFIVKISSRDDVMGKYKNNTVVRIVGWLTFCLMVVAAVGAIWAIF